MDLEGTLKVETSVEMPEVTSQGEGEVAEMETEVEGEQVGDVQDDVLWLADLQFERGEEVPLEDLSFGFNNFDIGFGSVNDVVAGDVAEPVLGGVPVPEIPTVEEAGPEATVPEALIVAEAPLQVTVADAERAVAGLTSLRAAPHPDLLDAAKGKEKSPSAHNDMWAQRRADQLRSSQGWNMKVRLGDLPLDQMDELLSNLFARVVKVSGKEYPAASLMNMLGGFNRIIRRGSDLRSLNGLGYPPRVEKDFNIKTHPRFVKTRLVLRAAIKKTAKDGTNKKTLKVEIMTEAMEDAICADVDHQLTNPAGCQKLLVMFLMVRFGTRRGKELWGLQRDVIKVCSDSSGREYVKYEERQSKNNCYNLDRYAEHQFRKVYHSYEAKLLMCVKQYMRHMPAIENTEERSLLLQPIQGPATNVWYNRVQKVGRDKCSGYLKNMAALVGIPPAVFSNKSGRATLITRMAARGVPDEVGMLMSGHHTTDGYLRYDRSQAVKMEAAAIVAADPTYSYQAALAQVSTKFVQDKIVGNPGDYKPLVMPNLSQSCEASSSTVIQGSSSSGTVVTNTGVASALTKRVNGKAVAISMCHEAGKSSDTSQQMRVSGPTQEATAANGQQQLQMRVSGPTQEVTTTNGQQQLIAWHKDYDLIDWEAEMAKNPMLWRALENVGGSHLAVGSRIGSNLAGNTFRLGDNCTINLFCAKEEDKENQRPN